MEKIGYKTPIVEMDGDEMTRVLWKMIKDILLSPYVELNTKYFDLSIQNRDKTEDEVTRLAAEEIKKYKVGVKCATITANKQREKEYSLRALYPSPNATIRAILDGTVFRTPIIIDGVKPYIPTWTKPIVIARHAYGDIYKSVESRVEKGGKAELVITNGNVEKRIEVFNFDGGDGIVLGMHNTDSSIFSFAKTCFEYALEKGLDLWFSAKDTISKTYDHRFKDIFEELFETEYKDKFEKAGIAYNYTLIDDAVARIIRSGGGFIWACKNYDGDVMSDMVATAYGSLAMMTSVLVSPDGNFEYEAAHGTVTRHYYKYLAGEETSTNPCATIFAWTGALKKRGELDGNVALSDFAEKLEKATIQTIESGFMTGDLIPLFEKRGVTPVKLSSEAFLKKITEFI